MSMDWLARLRARRELAALVSGERTLDETLDALEDWLEGRWSLQPPASGDQPLGPTSPG